LTIYFNEVESRFNHVRKELNSQTKFNKLGKGLKNMMNFGLKQSNNEHEQQQQSSENRNENQDGKLNRHRHGKGGRKGKNHEKKRISIS